MMPHKKVAVVTGSNTGIGKEVAAALLADHHVIMACRRMDACEQARAELLRASPDASASCLHLDLEDFASVRRFAAELPEAAPGPLDVLVNNSGVMGVAPGPAGDRHFIVNHLGTFLLTRLLLPLMAPQGRVVTVGSEAHRRGSLHIDASSQASIIPTHREHWYAAYARSKLANSLMTAELERRLAARGSGVATSCVSPGRVATDIFRNLGGLVGAAVSTLAALAFQTPRQGASGVVRAATDPALAGRHVAYIHMGREAAPAAAARDAALAARLWEASCREVGLSPEEDAALWPPPPP